MTVGYVNFWMLAGFFGLTSRLKMFIFWTFSLAFLSRDLMAVYVYRCMLACKVW